jgi:hypothetical protein
MDCPKCGFTQPNDRYCAKCGVDVEAYHKKPAGLITRLANNPNLHLGVIALVIGATLAYLVISQRELIQQEVGRIFPGIPLLSHSAMDQNENDEEKSALNVNAKAAALQADAETDGALENEAGFVKPGPRTKQGPEATASPSVEVRYMEVSKENINALVSSGQVVRELENWRVVFLPKSPSIKSFLPSSRPLPGSVKRALPPQGNLEILSGDYDPDPNAIFLNFSMIWKMPDSADWSLITQIPSAGAGGAKAPLVLQETEGKMKWQPGGALLFIFDPLQRIPVAAEAPLERSPLRVLKSSDFQNGLSNMIIWIEVTHLPLF